MERYCSFGHVIPQGATCRVSDLSNSTSIATSLWQLLAYTRSFSIKTPPHALYSTSLSTGYAELLLSCTNSLDFICLVGLSAQEPESTGKLPLVWKVSTHAISDYLRATLVGASLQVTIPHELRQCSDLTIGALHNGEPNVRIVLADRYPIRGRTQYETRMRLKLNDRSLADAHGRAMASLEICRLNTVR